MKYVPLLLAAVASAVTPALAGCAGTAEAQVTPAPAAPTVAAPVAAAPAPQRDPAVLGRALYLNCAACHATNAGEPQKIGPHLAAIMGRQAGTMQGFAFSPALRESGIVWDRETLDQFLARPANLVPSTSMAFGGLETEAQRSAMIAYLETLD